MPRTRPTFGRTWPNAAKLYKSLWLSLSVLFKIPSFLRLGRRPTFRRDIRTNAAAIPATALRLPGAETAPDVLQGPTSVLARAPAAALARLRVPTSDGRQAGLFLDVRAAVLDETGHVVPTPPKVVAMVLETPTEGRPVTGVAVGGRPGRRVGRHTQTGGLDEVLGNDATIGVHSHPVIGRQVGAAQVGTPTEVAVAGTPAPTLARAEDVVAGQRGRPTARLAGRGLPAVVPTPRLVGVAEATTTTALAVPSTVRLVVLGRVALHAVVTLPQVRATLALVGPNVLGAATEAGEVPPADTGATGTPANRA